LGEIKKTNKEKLVVGFIYKDAGIFGSARKALVKKFGSADFESRELDFIYTDYYNEEMGKGLKRKFLSFNKPVNPGKLAEIKIFANKTEQKFTDGAGKRKINIDPGLLSLANLILATTKNFSHRIYIGKGIYAEVTLQYKDGNFTTLPWTYPDYASNEYMEILNDIRKKYKEQAV